MRATPLRSRRASLRLADEELTRLTAELVALDSINPTLIRGAAGEREAAEFVADWARGRGLDVELVGDPARPSAIVTARGTGGGRSLLLNGHLDTVGVSGMQSPHEPRTDNGRMYGRGTYDMKGGIAAILDATAQAAGRSLRGDVIVTAVADEEVASIGTEAVLERVRADAAIVVEPTELQLAVAHKGFAGFEIETKGVAAHGSRPHLGVDAIAKMGPVLVALEELDARLRAGPRHPLLGTPSVHASLIEGGQEFSSYPARCLLTGERRTLPGETVSEVERELRGLAGDAELRMLVSREPFEIDPRHGFVELVHRCAGEPEIVGVSFWADSGLIGAAGIPTVLFGPLGEGAHGVEEWVDLDSVERVRDVCLSVAVEWCI
jgi:acetylornithine deacetylase/succinyl-diaminopimelate desuccinylase-like protein